MSTNIIVPDDPNRLAWEMTLGDFVDQAVSVDPYKVYLYFQQYQVTYQELREYSLRSAMLFRNLGVGHGDRVCVFLPNGREVLFIWLGLARLGAICVPINTAYKQEELAYILNNAQAVGLVSHQSLLKVAEEAAQSCPSLGETLVVADGNESYGGSRDFWELLRETAPLAAEDAPEVSPKDISMLVYTSGTTGDPKGVMISHEMYVAAGQGFATWTAATAEDRFFTCLPYFHANPQYYSTMGSLAAQASLVVTERFSASRFWEQVRESKATIINFIGMMMPVLLKNPPLANDQDNSARLFYGSPAPTQEVLAEFESRYGSKVIIAFGMTETCYGTIERLDEDHRPGSAGLPRWHPDTRFQNVLRILDVDGRGAEPRAVGEIALRNPAVMPGYWRDPERTAEALRDGWLHTGDLGWVDEDGHLYFVDRKKDVVRRRGENISSQEVENVIKRHPGVADCAVIGVPSELGEDEVKAYVVPVPPQSGSEAPPIAGAGPAQLTPDDVIYWCADRLAYFKVPRYLEFREELPRTPTLRVRKDELRREREDLTSGCFDREAAGIQLR